MSIIYRLIEEDIHEIYDAFPTGNQQSVLSLQAKSSILSVPNNYQNEDFFQKRDEIQTDMLNSVNEVFATYNSQAIMVVITDVTFGSSFESKFIEQQVQKRDAETAVQ